MNWLNSIVNPGGAYEVAQGQLNKYYDQSQGYLNPYNAQGQAAGNQLSGALGQLLNPQDLQNQWINSYQESPYAKQLAEQSKQNGLSAASSMGLLGSSPALQSIQAGQTNIFNKDRSNFLADLLDKYKTGIGLGQNLYGAGANAANSLSQNANAMGQNSGSAAYGQYAAPGNMLGHLLGGGASILGALASGGYFNAKPTGG